MREQTGNSRPEKGCYIRVNGKGKNKGTQGKGTWVTQDKKKK
jgi:hypothetical protein